MGCAMLVAYSLGFVPPEDNKYMYFADADYEAEEPVSSVLAVLLVMCINGLTMLWSVCVTIGVGIFIAAATLLVLGALVWIYATLLGKRSFAWIAHSFFSCLFSAFVHQPLAHSRRLSTTVLEV